MNKAFTLIETLVAISVLLLSLAGPLSIAAQALQGAYYARDQVTASYLAQEAVEYVRAIRDQNYLANPVAPWLTGIDDPDTGCVSVGCTVDFPNFSHERCSGACAPILLGVASDLYNHEDGAVTPFTRTLTLIPVNAGEVSVQVTVSWHSAGIDRSFRITEQLFDWL